jgi:hypothetical protein
MKVLPISQPTLSEQHTEAAEQVQVRVIQPTDTAPIQPSVYAQRLERQLAQATVVEPAQIRPETPPAVRACKNVLHSMAMVFGALFVPSFALVLLGPIGLVAPAALLVAAAVCAFLGGKPTEEMEKARAIRRAEMQEYDPR